MRVKRLTDTYFISVDVAHGSVRELHAEAARVMRRACADIRLCCVDGHANVTYVCDEHARGGDGARDTSPDWAALMRRRDVVFYAVFRSADAWEQPCVVDYPPADAFCTQRL